LYTFQEAFSIVIIRNPVFILQDDRIYYLKTKKWYELANYNFENKHIGKVNLHLTFCMLDLNKKIIFSENNWLIKNVSNFKDIVKYRRANTMRLKLKNTTDNV